jgi:hypothetical protein
MKTVQFFANTLAASVAGIFGFRAFAGLVETEQAYNPSSFFAGGMLVANLIALVLIVCALRARYETTDTSLRQWCQNIVLTLCTFIFASVVVITFMSSIPLGIIATVVCFVIFSLVLREFRDSVEDYVDRKEFVLVPPMALATFGIVGTSFFIDDHPLVAFVVMGVLMVFGAGLSSMENRIASDGDVLLKDELAAGTKPASDAPGQQVNIRV